MTIGTLVDTKQEAINLKKQFNQTWPDYKYRYCKLKYAYYVYGEKCLANGEMKKE
jgi:hypothetical protein